MGSVGHQMAAAHETVERSLRVFEPIPPRHLYHEGGVGRYRVLFDDGGRIGDHPRCAIGPNETGVLRKRSVRVGQPTQLEDGVGRRTVERLVRWGEHVDAGRDDHCSVGREVVPHVCSAGEDQHVGGQHPGPRKAPG
jgi:hypothetical protein